jgi:ElaB/YqjD/DUF883 family membrane-anchored ribosome-binding protein
MFTATKEAGNDAVTDLKKGASRIGAEASKTYDNVKSDVRSGVNSARDEYDSNRGDWEGTAREFGAQARHYFEDARGELRDTANEIRGRITRNPVESSLVALAVGFVLGQLFRR